MNFFDLSLAILSLFIDEDDVSHENLELILKRTYEQFHNRDLITVSMFFCF